MHCFYFPLEKITSTPRVNRRSGLKTREPANSAIPPCPVAGRFKTPRESQRVDNDGLRPKSLESQRVTWQKQVSCLCERSCFLQSRAAWEVCGTLSLPDHSYESSGGRWNHRQWCSSYSGPLTECSAAKDVPLKLTSFILCLLFRLMGWHDEYIFVIHRISKNCAWIYIFRRFLLW